MLSANLRAWLLNLEPLVEMRLPTNVLYVAVRVKKTLSRKKNSSRGLHAFLENSGTCKVFKEGGLQKITSDRSISWFLWFGWRPV